MVGILFDDHFNGSRDKQRNGSNLAKFQKTCLVPPLYDEIRSITVMTVIDVVFM